MVALDVTRRDRAGILPPLALRSGPLVPVQTGLSGLSTDLAIVAIAMAMFPRLLTAVGAPAIVNFLHFLVTVGVTLLVAPRIRSRDAKGLLSALYCLLFLMLSSSFANNAGLINAALDFVLLSEPFLVLILLTHEPMSPQQLRRLRQAVLAIVAIHALLAYYQFLVLGLRGDDVKGLFLAQGAGHHVAGAVALSTAAYILIALPNLGLSLRLILSFACATIVVLSDAKQVIAVFLASLATLAILQGQAVRVVRLVTFTATACVGLLVAANTFFPALKAWATPAQIQAGLLQKGSVFPLLVSHFESPANWLLGMGPGHTGGRLGELIPTYRAYLAPLGVTTSPITDHVREARDASWLSRAGTGSSMWSLIFSWAAVFGDLGLLGVGVLVGLWLLVWRSCRGDEFSRFLVLNVFFFAATFSWLEEPGYMMLLAALIALSWQQRSRGTPAVLPSQGFRPLARAACNEGTAHRSTARNLGLASGRRRNQAGWSLPDGHNLISRGRLRALVSAYSCEPGKGSEPGVGWNMACALAAHHDVWVITRAASRALIDRELEGRRIPGLRFVYFDLPGWFRWLQKGEHGTQVHYYLWQYGAYRVARRLHRSVGFDLAHHLTFVKFWTPSFMSLLPVPFVWGPVGGGESAPRSFWTGFGLRGLLYEAIREGARWVAQRDPFVRMTAKRSALTLATTVETERLLRRLHVPDPKPMLATGISDADLEKLAPSGTDRGTPVRFVSVGRLLHLKGFHLALKAFAELDGIDAEYWIIGDGPEEPRLRRLAASLGLTRQVSFWGSMPRDAVLQRIKECDVLVHPSLHESGGLVCLEAMAAAKPVICLDLGGPSLQVTPEAGVRIPALSPSAVIQGLVRAMTTLARDPSLCRRLGAAGRRRIIEEFLWTEKARRMSLLYRQVVRLAREPLDQAPPAHPTAVARQHG